MFVLFIGTTNISIAGEDGEIKWTFGMDPWSADPSYLPTPAIGEGEVIYAANWAGIVYAIDREGNELWQIDTGNRIIESPVIGDDGTIYVTNYTKMLYAINPDGTLKWSRPGESKPTFGPDGTVYTTASVNQALKKLNAYSSDGGLKWSKINFSSYQGIAVDQLNGTVYVGNYALNPQDGSTKWIVGSGHSMYTATLSQDESIVYQIARYDVYAVDVKTGNVIWQCAPGGIPQSIEAIGEDGTIYVKNHLKEFFAISSTGNLKWQYSLSGNVQEVQVGIDNNVYVKNNIGELYAIKPDGSTMWSFNCSRLHGVASDGVIYFSSGIDGFTALNPDGTVKWRNMECITSKFTGVAHSTSGVIYFNQSKTILRAVYDKSSPRIELSCNGQVDFISVSPGDLVRVSADVFKGSYEGEMADWWVVHKSKRGIFNEYESLKLMWECGIERFKLAPIEDYSDIIFSTNNLPMGDHYFYFAIDKNTDNIPDGSWMDVLHIRVE